MRTVLLANNRVGAEIGQYLASRRELIALVLHPADKRKEGPLLEALAVPTWVWPHGLEEIRALRPECLLSVHFSYKLPPAWLSSAAWRPLNLHPGLLPFNRGATPNVWPLVDGSPAGVTLHVMDEDFDTGDVMCQQRVPTYPDDTARSLYIRLEAASVAMFRRVWPDVGDLVPSAQTGQSSLHRMADLATLDLSADDMGVLDRLRARTYPPYGAEFVRDGQRYRVRVEIEPIRQDGGRSAPGTG